MTTGPSEKSITGIILAGGKSSRMGKEKGLVPFRGEPLISYSLELLIPFCGEIIISANTPEYKSFGYPVITDEISGAGPMGGLYSALKHSTTYENLVLPCDTPFINKEFIRFLLASVSNQPAVIPVHPDGKAEPLCGYYTRDLVPLMKDALDNAHYKIIDFLEQTGTLFLKTDNDLPFYHPDLFVNLNTPEELKKYS